MGQGHQRGGEHLADTETTTLGRGDTRGALGHPIGQFGTQVRGQTGDQWGQQCRQQHLGDHGSVVDNGETRTGNRRTDESAEEGVGRAGGQTEQPGQHIPDDGAHEAGKDDLGSNGEPIVPFVDQAAGNRGGDLGGKEGTHQVQDRGQGHCRLGLNGAGGDRGCHGIGRIVKPVREIKEQSQGNHQDNDECEIHLGTNLEMAKERGRTAGSSSTRKSYYGHTFATRGAHSS